MSYFAYLLLTRDLAEENFAIVTEIKKPQFLHLPLFLISSFLRTFLPHFGHLSSRILSYPFCPIID